MKPRPEDSVDALVHGTRAGDVRAAARLIRWIDDGHPRARDAMKALFTATGRALVLGVTGPPGAGKSTLVDCLIACARRAGRSVGVLAIDPSSPLSGGAVLGDRIRMQRFARDPAVFIRSLATRGHFGGVTPATRGAIRVMDALGKDVILVETVGVGQDEVDIARLAHTTLVVAVPGLGDAIQAMKAGILEVADIFVVNKADHPDVERTVADLESLSRRAVHGAWLPPVIKTEALRHRGIDDLWQAIERHRECRLGASLDFQAEAEADATRELEAFLREGLHERLAHRLAAMGDYDTLVRDVAARRVDIYAAADSVLARLGWT